MTDYVLLLLAVLCFTAQFAFTRLFENAVKPAIITTLIMLIVTSTVGCALYLSVGGFRVAFSTATLFWAVVMAVIMIPYYAIGIKVLSLGSLAIYSMFMMLGGMLVPFFYGIIFLNEDLSVGKILGVILLSLFIVFQAISQHLFAKGKSSEQVKGTGRLFIFLCVLIFLINGLTGVVAKAHQISLDAVDEISFTVISCAITAVFSTVLLCIRLCRRTNDNIPSIKASFKRAALLSMIFIGIFTYTGNFLHLKAAANIPASIQFPVVSGGVIVFSAFISAFLFREKISKSEWLSIAGAFASTVLFAF